MAKKKTKKKTTPNLKKKAVASKPKGKNPAMKKAPASPARMMVAKRADLGADIGIYFDKLAGDQRKTAEALRDIIQKAAPRATSAVKWGMPVFEHKGMLCYIRARPKYVTLGFYESGVSLGDPDGLLEGTGDNMRHIKVASLAAVRPEYFGRLVKEAVAFNDRTA